MAERRPAPGDHLVIAIDGPSGSGKSTVARGVAERLGIGYLDTGAMYRAVTWAVLQRGTSLDAADDVAEVARTLDLHIGATPGDRQVSVEGTDVTTAIRQPDVTAAVSRVSAVPGVREALVRRQRAVIATGPAVVEGRDIGTVVAPDAAIKVFLTADPAERADRRGRELAGAPLDEARRAATEAALRSRDAADSSRAVSPLEQAPDAIVIDSTHVSADEVIARILAEVAAAGIR